MPGRKCILLIVAHLVLGAGRAPGQQPGANPLLVHYTGENGGWRPMAMIEGPEGKVYLGAMAAAVWLITSPTAAVKVRDTADRTWRRVTGQNTDLIRRDDDSDLASLLDSSQTDTSETGTWAGTGSDVDGIIGASVTDVEVTEAGRPSGV